MGGKVFCGIYNWLVRTRILFGLGDLHRNRRCRMKHLINAAIVFMGIVFLINRVNDPLAFVITFVSLVFFLFYAIVAFFMDITK